MNSSYMQQRRNNVPFVSASDMNKAIPPTIQKALYGMTFPELLDYWTGYAVMEIGRGHSLRDAISLMLQNTMRISYERGIADGKSGKRGGA